MLGKETATLSRILAWRIPWTEAPGEATVHGVAESDPTELLSLAPHFVAKTEAC